MKGTRNTVHAEMEGKEPTLLEAVRQLEGEVNKLMQVLEFNVPIATEENAPYTACAVAA